MHSWLLQTAAAASPLFDLFHNRELAASLMQVMSGDSGTLRMLLEWQILVAYSQTHVSSNPISLLSSSFMPPLFCHPTSEQRTQYRLCVTRQCRYAKTIQRQGGGGQVAAKQQACS